MKPDLHAQLCYGLLGGNDMKRLEYFIAEHTKTVDEKIDTDCGVKTESIPVCSCDEFVIDFHNSFVDHHNDDRDLPVELTVSVDSCQVRYRYTMDMIATAQAMIATGRMMVVYGDREELEW